MMGKQNTKDTSFSSPVINWGDGRDTMQSLTIFLSTIFSEDQYFATLNKSNLQKADNSIFISGQVYWVIGYI